MSVAMIVTVIGLGAVLSRRVQLRTLEGANDLAEAQRYARGGMQMAIEQINRDDNWRDSFATTTWADGRPIGAGSYTLDVSDPTDNDLTDSSDDPVRIVATGAMNHAEYRLEARLEVQREDSPLGSALHAYGSVTIQGATVEADLPISANGSIDASMSALVYADVEASGEVTGSDYKAGVTAGANQRLAPDPLELIATLQNRATVIGITDLPFTGDNALINPDFEDGASGWASFITPLSSETPCTLTADQTVTRTGSDGSLAVTDRKFNWQGPAQDITGQAVNGHTLHVEAYVQPDTVQLNDARIVVVVMSADETVTYIPTASFTAKTNAGWTKISGDLKIAFPGTLSWAQLVVATETGTDNFYVDDVTVYPVDGASPRVLERVALGPNSNPYGATNDQGLYAIDCAGADLIIRDSRIAGSLLLSNPGAGTRLEGALHWRTLSLDLPALTVQGSITIATDSAALSEWATGVNFNADDAWPLTYGATDTDQDDNYPSRIRGLVYVTGSLSLEQNPMLHGSVVAGGNVVIQSETLKITHEPDQINNPPTGFDVYTRTLQLVEASMRRDVQ
jgi:hypothetical protein